MANSPSRDGYRFFKLSRPAEYVAHVEIDRADKLNAFYDPMWRELKVVFDGLSTDQHVRCVLLSGAGDRAFTAGLDVTAATTTANNNSSSGSSSSSNSGGGSGGDGAILAPASDPSRKADFLRRHILDLQSCVSAIEACAKPVIALMHGYVYGLGIDIGTACDVRLCAQGSRFCVKEVDIGLAADVGTLSRLPKVMGGTSSWVKEVCLTAREFDAAEALQVGFVSGVMADKAGLMEEGVKMARAMAGKSPVAVQGTKHILDATPGRTVHDHLYYTAVWNAAMLQSSDVERAMGSAMKKRKPTFEKL